MKLLITASIMMFSIGVFAQTQDNHPSPPKQRTPEEIAKAEADMMKAELNLTDKQYKKVYKLIKKDHEYRQSQMENAFAEGMPPQGGMPGGMPQGGMPGGMSGGMPGGMGGGRPPMGEMGQMPRPEGGQPGMKPLEDIVTEEYLEKQENKLKKILTEEQYSKWRSKHPAEQLELPPFEFEKIQ